MKNQKLARFVSSAFSNLESEGVNRNAALFRIVFFMLLWAVLSAVLVADIFVTPAESMTLGASASLAAPQPAANPVVPNLLALAPTR
jgi:hypothetical protein